MPINKKNSIFFDNHTGVAQESEPAKLAFKKGVGRNLDYEIIQKQVVVANNQTVSNTQTNMVWQITDISQHVSDYTLQLNQIAHEIVKCNPLLKDLAAFAKLFNLPFAKLNLQFANTGKLERILNQEEIHNVWEDLKNTQLKIIPDSKEIQGLIKAGDIEFSDSLSVIHNSFLYRLFFPEVYQVYTDDTGPIKTKKVFKSNIFTNNLVEFDITQVINRSSSNELVVEQDYRSIKDSPYINDLLEIYNSQYKPLFIEDFAYNYRFKIIYTLYKDSGIVKDAVCEMKESVNSSYDHISTYTITLKSVSNG